MKKNLALMGVLAAAVMATSVPAVAAETAAETKAAVTATEEKKDEAAATATEEKKDEAAVTATEEKKDEAAVVATEEKKDEAAVAETAPEAAPEAAPVNNDGIKVTVDGTAVVFDQEPVIKEGRTLVPLRAIFEAFGATIEWNAETKTVVATDADGVAITLTVGSKEMKIGDKVVILDAPAQIVKDRTLVPVRAIAEAFGAEVAWDAATKTVAIQKPVAEVVEEATAAPAEATTETKTEAKADEKTDAKTEVKTDAKAEATTDTKTEVKTDATTAAK